VAKQLVSKKFWCVTHQLPGCDWVWFTTCSKCNSQALWIESGCSIHKLVPRKVPDGLNSNFQEIRTSTRGKFMQILVAKKTRIMMFCKELW